MLLVFDIIAQLFYRDAPEPTGEEGEEADMELPKVYEPVMEEAQLRERLEMFLSQFNEMVRGAGMDLVFFPDAIFHLVKVNLRICELLITKLLLLIKIHS